MSECARRVALYNFNLSARELQAQLAGSWYGGQPGWAIFETYFPSGLCPALPSIRAAPIQCFNGSSWSNLVAPYASNFSVGNCIAPNGPYRWYELAPKYDWEVRYEP